MSYKLSSLQVLEAEAIHIIREVYAQFDAPCLLFSGGKDSIVVSYLARKAFYPSPIPFPLVHIDTGHNFPETLKFRDEWINTLNATLVVGSVQKSIDENRVQEEMGIDANRNALQSCTLLETIEEYGFDACLGGARRDEEKARAKERIFSHRDAFGQWNPRNQRPELWKLYNGEKNTGEHFRVFPISNWTELDIWQYISQEKIQLPPLYFAHERKLIQRGSTWIPYADFIPLNEGEKIETKRVRFRTLGDMTITGAIESSADTLEKIIQEVALAQTTERAQRADDKRGDAAMEDRKKEGYF